VLVHSELHTATKKQDQKGWKARQEKLAGKDKHVQKRGKGYRHTKDDR